MYGVIAGYGPSPVQTIAAHPQFHLAVGESVIKCGYIHLDGLNITDDRMYL
jgi:hypothetical protein